MKINLYKEQCIYVYHNINIKLFSRYDVENTQVKVIIHVWYALADKSATPQKLYGQSNYFQILSTFSYNICVGCQLGNTIWLWAEACNFI